MSGWTNLLRTVIMLKTVVLVDDDQDDIDFFSQALFETDSPVELYSFLDCQDMLARVQTMKNLPDLIFLDVNMPEMTGWECLKEMRKVSAFQAVPVIVYSTSSPSIYSNTLKNSGAIAMYEKAVDFQRFKEFIGTLISPSVGGLRYKLQKLQDSRKHSLIIA